MLASPHTAARAAAVGREVVTPPADITNGVGYGDILEVGNTANPTGVVTLLHGLGDSSRGMQPVVEQLAVKLPHLLFLVPSSAHLSQTQHLGVLQPAWFDIIKRTTSRLSTGQQNTTTLFNSVDYVMKLTRRTCDKYGVPPHRVCVGGFSQGAAVSAAAALVSASLPPAGVFLMSGFLPTVEETLARHKKLVEEDPGFAERFRNPEKAMQFAMFHGRQDPVIHLTVALESKDLIEKNILSKMADKPEGKVELREFNMQHTITPEEVREVSQFIARVLPGPAASTEEDL